MSTIPDESAVPITLHVEPANAKVLLDFLKTLPFVAIDSVDELFITPGQANPDEKPSDFAGIWQESPRSLADIRRRAWPKRRN